MVIVSGHLGHFVVDTDTPHDAALLKAEDQGPTGIARVPRWPGWLPPARTVWIALAILAGYGTLFLRGTSLPSLLLLPALAAAVDLGLQRVRFSSLRLPDAALATGLFLVLLLPPVVPLVAAVSVTVAAIVLRHAIRFRGHPVMNPAAMGLLIGAVLFGTAPAWWVALGPYGLWLMLGLAAVVLARNSSRWQLLVAFFAIYAPFMVVDRILFGAALAPHVLLLEVLDPSVLFFGLYMVMEPRTAPSAPAGQLLYGGVVALAAVFLPTVLPSVGIVVALLLGNLVAVVIRWEQSRSTESGIPNRPAKPRRSATQSVTPARWSVSRRTGAAMLVVLAVAVVASASVSPATTPSVLVSAPPSSGGSGGGGSGGGSGGGVGASLCSADNTNIPAATLSSLHSMLGPSVILSYSPNSGLVVFYDPVNQVTVTETDLYEDYGYAEFNGDDFAVSGCAP